MVVETVRDPAFQRSSIDHIVEKLIRRAGLGECRAQQQLENALRQATLAIVGCLTGFFTAALSPNPAALGHLKAARRLFHRIERHRATKPDDAAYLDPLLNQLCGHEAPIESLVTARSLRDKMVYEAADFASLGPQLAKVQEFVQAHEVIKIRDRWRDRTNQVEWRAFWTLLIFGVISFVLTAVQTALAAAQLQAQLR
ncbi:hypothetical protein HRG_009991 [Hirsutella rhossiliensis]|uniref:Transmembrane protein n=1 Tax=Hirsutella rhossiliensis TaxID=111463 RepID=A0A9P8MRM8_9HYPO|nr:uncharacterized protein HRG_09991 [Hirsutella rhossiliensis]KAH0958946.1 hypothetical protein HRG_09991 [Hirsutella rhossiliensis]